MPTPIERARKAGATAVFVHQELGLWYACIVYLGGHLKLHHSHDSTAITKEVIDLAKELKIPYLSEVKNPNERYPIKA